MQEVKSNESLTIENRKRLYMTEVVSVDAFSEEMLKLTVGDKKVIVGGNNLKITAFNQTQKTLNVEGEIVQIKYEGAKSPLIKRFFK
jgi:hypothetical protein